MTRYTNMHGKPKAVKVKSNDEFTVTPLQPKKNAKGSQSEEENAKRKRIENRTPEQLQEAAEKRKKRRKMAKQKGTICFGCRQKGHAVSECPEAKTAAKGICYNCGSTEHSLNKCKKPRKGNELPYAKCFICKKEGHLSGQCPKNEKGLYPNGGSCRFCNQVDHLAKDCKLTKEEVGTIMVGKIDMEQGADDDDYHIFVEEKKKAEKDIQKKSKPQADEAKDADAVVDTPRRKKTAKKVVKF